MDRWTERYAPCLRGRARHIFAPTCWRGRQLNTRVAKNRVCLARRASCWRKWHAINGEQQRPGWKTPTSRGGWSTVGTVLLEISNSMKPNPFTSAWQLGSAGTFLGLTDLDTGPNRVSTASERSLLPRSFEARCTHRGRRRTARSVGAPRERVRLRRRVEGEADACRSCFDLSKRSAAAPHKREKEDVQMMLSRSQSI